MLNLSIIQDLSDSGRHQECLQACQNALEVDPENISIYKLAGSSLLALGQSERAHDFLNHAHQLDGSDYELAKHIGNIYLNQGFCEDALRWYQKSLSINPHYAPAINNIATLKRQSGKNQQAFDLYQLAIQLDPQLIQAYQGAAVSLLGIGDINSALLFAQKAFAIDADLPGINELIGIIFQKQGKLPCAIKSYQKELSVNPNASSSILNLGFLLLQQGEVSEAVNQLEKASILAPSDQCTFLLANAYQDLGRFKKAISEYKKIKITSVKNKIIPFNLGACFLELCQYNEAVEAFQIAIQLDPAFVQAWGSLGNALQELGRLKKAKQAFQTVLDLEPDNEIALMNLGIVYRNLGELDKALETTLKSLQIKPDYHQAQTNLGLIYRMLGDTDQALYFLKEATKNCKPDENSLMALGELYADLGLYNDGIKAIVNISNKKAKNLLLSLYLCMDWRLEFKKCADNLVAKKWLDSRGVAAVDHANVLYKQSIDNGLSGSTLDAISTYTIDKNQFSDELMRELIDNILEQSPQSRAQDLLINGFQTSGNIFDQSEKPYQIFKELLIQKIDLYNQSSVANIDGGFRDHWNSNMYQLSGWAIVMNSGGNLRSHNHELGWLTGTFYLQLPETDRNLDEGAIEFTHKGHKYPDHHSVFESKIIRPNVRDLNIFPSSLFHRTLPFKSETQRICIAFDLARKE